MNRTFNIFKVIQQLLTNSSNNIQIQELSS